MTLNESKDTELRNRKKADGGAEEKKAKISEEKPETKSVGPVVDEEDDEVIYENSFFNSLYENHFWKLCVLVPFFTGWITKLTYGKEIKAMWTEYYNENYEDWDDFKEQMPILVIVGCVWGFGGFLTCMLIVYCVLWLQDQWWRFRHRHQLAKRRTIMRMKLEKIREAKEKEKQEGIDAKDDTKKYKAIEVLDEVGRELKKIKEEEESWFF